LENNGGFASVRSVPVKEDLSNQTAFLVRVRGDGRRYKFTARNGTGFGTPIYQHAFTTKPGEWVEHRFEFAEFVPTFRGRVLRDVPPLNPTKGTSLGFLISDQQAGPFRLEIAWIKAVPPGGEDPTANKSPDVLMNSHHESGSGADAPVAR
jgi:hypothetical protein